MIATRYSRAIVPSLSLTGDNLTQTFDRGFENSYQSIEEPRVSTENLQGLDRTKIRKDTWVDQICLSVLVRHMVSYHRRDEVMLFLLFLLGESLF